MPFAIGLGSSGADTANSVAVDSAGNSYVTGYYSGTMDFDPNSTTVLNHTSAGQADVFIAKYDSSGALVWAKSVGGERADQSYSIVIDENGNSYVTGDLRGTADFDPGDGTRNLTASGTGSKGEVFVAKYDSNGDLVWANSFGGSDSDTGEAIATDSAGNSYVTGVFSGTADFDPGVGEANLTALGRTNTFVAKYDANGDFVWSKGLIGTENDNNFNVEGHAITADGAGNSYVTGTFSGTADFDPSDGVTLNLTSASGSYDPFFAKYDSNGDLVWARHLAGSGFIEQGSSIAVDGTGSSYVAGYFSGTTDFDTSDSATLNLTKAGGNDGFFAKYDGSGDLVWAKSIGGAGDDRVDSITLDNGGNSYVAGYFSGTADFDPGIGTEALTSAGSRDAFIAKYDSSGALVWARQVGGSGSDWAKSIEVGADGNIYIAGSFNGTADFDPGSGTEELTSAASSDAFLLKLDSDGNFVTVSSGPTGGGSSGSSGGGLSVTNQTAADTAGSATGRTLVNNSGGSATGALVENTGNGNVVNVTLPSGVSLTNSGTSTAESSGTAGTTLTGEIQSTEPDSSDQSFLDGHGQTFIAGNSGTELDIRSITFSSTDSTAQTVQLTGQGSSGAEAFVIDTSGLPSGSTLQLDNIEFAAIVGNATVTGGAGQNYVVGDDAQQFISLGAEDDTLAGGGGDDTIGSGYGEDILYGNQGADSVFGGGGMDTLYGGQDGDTVRGDNDDDVLYGNKGDDTLFGGENADLLYGGQDADIVYGNAGNDTLHGNLGDDALYGGQDNDIVSGGDGSDFLAGNKGDDTLVGGSGADTFYFEFEGGTDQISDFTAGEDTLAFESGLTYSAADSGGNTVITTSDGGTVTLIGVSKSSLGLAATAGWDLA